MLGWGEAIWRSKMNWRGSNDDLEGVLIVHQQGLKQKGFDFAKRRTMRQGKSSLDVFDPANVVSRFVNNHDN